MKIKLFDKVLLKNGKTAHIVEIYEHGKAYEADILVDDSGEYLDYETETIRPEDIDKIIKQLLNFTLTIISNIVSLRIYVVLI